MLSFIPLIRRLCFNFAFAIKIKIINKKIFCWQLLFLNIHYAFPISNTKKKKFNPVKKVF